MDDSRFLFIAEEVQVFDTPEEARAAALAGKENLDKRLLEHSEHKTKKQALDKLNKS